MKESVPLGKVEVLEKTPKDPVQKMINRTSVTSAVIGAILSPIPLVDEILLLPIYANMARRIARLRELPRKQMPWRPILRTTMNGLMARAGLNLAVSFIPGVAAIANAASAAVLTQLIGKYVDEAVAAPAEAKPIGVTAIVNALKAKLPRRAAAT